MPNYNLNYTGQELEDSVSLALDSIAEQFSESKSYVVNDLTIYGGDLFKCIANVEGEWDASKWVRTRVVDEFGRGSGSQVQTDWNQSTTTEVDFIKNKPSVKAGDGVSSIIVGDLTNNIASGEYSYAEGCGAEASGDNSHAEGDYTEASGRDSHAEGDRSTASAEAAHAEGEYTTASGEYSHSEGEFTEARGIGSHAEGCWTIAASDYQHVEGVCNVPDYAGVYASIVGWGHKSGPTKENDTYKNISSLTTTGDLHLAGSVYVGANDDGSGGSALVDSVNGKSGTVTLKGSDIELDDDNDATIDEAIFDMYSGLDDIDTKKQDKLTAGSNITIENNVISAVAGGNVDDVKVNGTSVVTNKVANVTVPTATSDLTNDSGFITTSAISDMATKTWVGNQGYLTTHQSLSDLGITATAAELNYVDGVTSSIQTQLNNKGTYSKPSTGIPKTDLASAVQTSLGKADTAVQPGSLATVATSGSYNDLINKPTIPDAIRTTTVTLPQFTAAGSQSVTLAGLLESSRPVLDVVTSTTAATAKTQISDWAHIYTVMATADTLIFYSDAATTQALTISVFGY